MLGRALFAFLTLPGIFAGIIPALVVQADTQRRRGLPIGYVLAALGLSLLLWCVRDFLVSGRGTLAPWDPPKHLVIVGLYRFTRNPMYVSITLLLAGWILAVGSIWLACYTIVLMVGFHLRVVLYEEPRLEKQFGDEWINYSASVPRWFLRRSTRSD
jgi:protein-S-isoprenylcysteine O-methyltransferase Ste14